MKRINNSDINFLLNPKTVNLSNFNVRFYTVNSENFFIRKSQDDVKTVEVETEDGETSVNYYLKLDWSELVTLGEGVLQYQLLNNYQDSDRPDNYYNQSLERTTQYYIDSNVTVDEDDAESYAEIIAELGDKIDAEEVRALSAETALDTKIDTISANTYTKAEVDTIIDNIEASGVSGNYLSVVTFEIYSADTNSKINGKANSSDLATVATSGNYNDLTNKPTIPIVPTSNTAFTNDAGYLTEHQDISGKLNVSDFNTYSAATFTAIGSKLDSTAYTPTDLTNYYTKSETSGATEISTALGNKQNTLVSGSNIKTINNTSILGSGNITIEGGSGSSGFIQVTNPDTAETKVGLVNSLSQYYDTNIGNGAVIEGDGYEYNGTNYNIVASGNYSHAEGQNTQASGTSSHAEGTYTKANGSSSHAEGASTTANGGYGSHAEGQSTVAVGICSHAEGQNTMAIGEKSHAEGQGTTAVTICSHAEGQNTQASGTSSHAEGTYTKANGSSSHAEGASTTASGNYSHAEGQSTVAVGICSHAEGQSTIASGGYCSHAEGQSTVAVGICSHAEGQSTIAKNEAEHASGRYNVSSSASTTFGESGNTLFSVGNGTNSMAMHNAFEIRQNGDIYISSGGTNTSPMVKLQDNLGGNVDLSNYYTKTEVDEIVDDVVAGQIDLTTYAKIDWVQTNYATKSEVPVIWTGTQAQYDALTTKVATTIYIITEE